MDKVLSIILGGGKGSRLYPLTQLSAKPAVPFGGKSRLIAIAISNCLNSGFSKIYILIQFESESLNFHISRYYQFDIFSKGFVFFQALNLKNMAVFKMTPYSTYSFSQNLEKK